MAKKVIKRGLTKLIRTKPVILIVTLHPDGTVNAGTFGAYINLSSDEIGIAIGKPSHTYKNIKRTGEFTVNVLTKKIVRASEICAQEIPPSESELDHASLTVETSRKVKPPIIKECVANLECIPVASLIFLYETGIVASLIFLYKSFFFFQFLSFI
ncbi:MAG: flavin reductase family protein [Candidatus Omnitrophica bacterium]|nr:flavin reductase family protein [Candidatus Omnitrophota bacterium]